MLDYFMEETWVLFIYQLCLLLRFSSLAVTQSEHAKNRTLYDHFACRGFLQKWKGNCELGRPVCRTEIGTSPLYVVNRRANMFVEKGSSIV